MVLVFLLPIVLLASAQGSQQQQLIQHTSADDFSNPKAMHLAEVKGDAVFLSPRKGEDAIFLSRTLKPTNSFDAVLASWNVKCPQGAGFSVEIRVSATGSSEWSPFLYVGDWGAMMPRPGRVKKCSSGVIDVDWFRGKNPCDRIQYRVKAKTNKKGRSLRISRMTLCLSLGIANPTDSAQTSKLAPKSWKRRLKVPYRSQKWEDKQISYRICSPTSVTMLMAYRGVKKPTEVVAHRCYDETHEIYGNWTRAIQGAFSFGVPGYLTRFSDWEDVRAMIAQGQPLIISIAAQKGQLTGAPYSMTEGHLLVLCGFDKNGNVEVNDPAAKNARAGQTTYLRKELEEVWMKRGGTTYVILSRGR